jgi:ribosomal protein S27E
MQLVCGQCGWMIDTGSAEPGERVTCGHCGQSTAVPDLSAPADGRQEAAGGFAESARQAMSRRRLIHVTCGACGKHLTAGMKRAGRQARCPHCGKNIRIPFPDDPEADVVWQEIDQDAEHPADEPDLAIDERSEDGDRPAGKDAPAGEAEVLEPVEAVEPSSAAGASQPTADRSSGTDHQAAWADDRRTAPQPLATGPTGGAGKAVPEGTTDPRARARVRQQRNEQNARSKATFYGVLMLVAAAAVAIFIPTFMSMMEQQEVDNGDPAEWVLQRTPGGGDSSPSGAPPGREPAAPADTPPGASTSEPGGISTPTSRPPAPKGTELTPVTAEVAVFAGGGRRPAPPGQVYWKISALLSAGGSARDLRLGRETVALVAGERRWPCERLVVPQAGGDVTVARLSLREGQQAEVGMTFLVPRDLREAAIRIEKVAEAAFALAWEDASAERLPAGTYEEAGVRNLKPAPADPLRQAVQRMSPVRMEVTPRGQEVLVTFPAARVRGRLDKTGPGRFDGTLTRFDERLDVSLVSWDGGKTLLLHLGPRGRSQLTLRRRGESSGAPTSAVVASPESRPDRPKDANSPSPERGRPAPPIDAGPSEGPKDRPGFFDG